MRHMGNSGRTAIVAAFAAAVLLVLSAITLEEAVLYTFLGAVAVGYLASVIQVVARGRNLALLAGGVGTSLFIGFAIAFLRMWGLAFTAEPDSLGAAVTTQDSDIYFYLAAVSGVGTLLVLFAGAVWPAGKRLRSGRDQSRRTQPVRRKPATAARRPAARPAAGTTYGRVPASRSGAVRAPAAKRAPSAAAKSPKSPAKAASRR
ncbi:hypothetical protein PV761_20205 [Arthrobacter sp. CC3]|uniref:hypothetical protein n=1 Tax=Arthrobacter sp. CC3 TaxID=3029185 RepID=UPI003265B281